MEIFSTDWILKNIYLRGDEMQLLINGSDVAKRAGNFIRSDNVDGLAMSFSFDVAFNKNDKYLPDLAINPGDKVVFVNGPKAVFAGIIVDESRGLYERSYTAYDYGWYLNKNEVIVQFRSMAADAAIQKLCDDFKIPVGSIAPMQTKITKIYNGDTLSDCFRDIIRQVEVDQAKSFRMEVREGKLYIEPYSDLIIKASFKPASNLAPFDSTIAPANEHETRSIEDMHNAVKVVSAVEESVQIIAEASDAVSMEQFGTLQKVEHIDGKNSAQAANIAKNLLLEANKIGKGKTVTLLGDDTVRSGRILDYQGKAFLVRSCTHYYNGTSHTMDLELEEVS